MALVVVKGESRASMDSIKILLVDPHQLSREGLKRLLDSETHAVIGAARSLDDAADQIAKGLAPDLLICGLEDSAPGDQSAIVDQIRTRFPNLKLVILANSVSSSLLLQAINAGINAYLLRDMSLEALSRSLELVMLGQQVFPTQAALMLVANRSAGPANAGSGLSSEAALRTRGVSGREGEILRSLLSGHSNKMIARQLGISEATVKVHLKAVMRKINAQNRTQVAVWGLANGFGEEVTEPKLAAV
jgi:two-component system nitrate/nitrite response regulator NarL